MQEVIALGKEVKEKQHESTRFDSLWDETGEIFSRWNLQEIPFSESASSLQSNLDKVFTGRSSELKQVFQLLLSLKSF